jgi:hypothetical protein
MIPSKISGFSFDTTLLMTFARRAELAVEAPVRSEGYEARGLLPLVSSQDLLHCRPQVLCAVFRYVE